MTEERSPFVQRIGIIGAGAMGSSLVPIVSRIAPTVLVCRNPKRAAQIFEKGIEVEGLTQDHARPIIVKSVQDLPTIGGVGILFIATKTTAIQDVCRELKPILNDVAEDDRGLRIVSYQNGIEPGREIMDLLETTRVLRMVLDYGAVLHEDTGRVEVTLLKPPHYIGCLDPDLLEETKQLAGRLTDAGFETEYDPGIESRVWAKAVVNAAVSTVAALVNSTIGQVLESPSRFAVERLLHEGMAVAEAEGINLGEDFEKKAFALLAAGAEHLPSMVHDIRHGKESEVGQLNRQIIRHARRVGIKVPTHETIDSLIETFDWRVYHAPRGQ